MNQSTKNVAVGLTVLVALVMFGGMILLFAGLPELLQTGRVLKVHTSHSAGVRVGEWVFMSGMQIGRITSVDFAAEDPAEGVVITCRINADVKIPGDVRPTLYYGSLGKGPRLDFQSGGEPRLDANTGRELAFLPDDWDTPLEGELVSPSMLPKKLTDGLDELSKLGKALSDLLVGPETQPGGDASTATATARKTATFGEALASFTGAMNAIEKTLGDPNNQDNLQKTLANLADASARAGEAMAELKQFASQGRTATTQAVAKIGNFADTADKRFNEIADKIVVDAEALSKVLATINRIATKMEDGDGTIPRLINDPKLYDSFTQASRQLTELAAELRTLVKQWKQTGVPLKLK